ncbi:hypothetical protein SAMN05216377_11786 [Pseudonocardia oroxyli]|uniref:Uncharacterized protein n=1 Tax=Pseudonocardia oroxyli TaxID=366584 RepID=A0A1G7YL41_PSEOR|nr:hypothetical protein SAMN05216377_11786 [Pseudonocardia oroxyli]
MVPRLLRSRCDPAPLPTPPESRGLPPATPHSPPPLAGGAPATCLRRPAQRLCAARSRVARQRGTSGAFTGVCGALSLRRAARSSVAGDLPLLGLDRRPARPRAQRRERAGQGTQLLVAARHRGSDAQGERRARCRHHASCATRRAHGRRASRGGAAGQQGSAGQQVARAAGSAGSARGTGRHPHGWGWILLPVPGTGSQDGGHVSGTPAPLIGVQQWCPSGTPGNCPRGTRKEDQVSDQRGCRPVTVPRAVPRGHVGPFSLEFGGHLILSPSVPLRLSKIVKSLTSRSWTWPRRVPWRASFRDRRSAPRDRPQRAGSAPA